VTDQYNHRIRRVTLAGVVTTLAGSASGAADGPGATATFELPSAIAADASANVYVGDANHRVRKLATTGIGELAVSWTPAADTPGSPITGYTATATAPGQAIRTCSAAVPGCTIRGAASGVAHSVTVVATSAAGASAPSAPATATPN
jgi:hypothetical protein